MYEYKALITNVVDGDTVDAEVDMGFSITVKTRFRLYGIDAMEIHDKDPVKRDLAQQAKQMVTANLLGKSVRILTYKPDKYGRYLAEFFLDDSLTMNQKLINEGLAVEYFGGTKTV